MHVTLVKELELQKERKVLMNLSLIDFNIVMIYLI